MVSLLVFYVCAIGLYIIIEARHYTRPLHISEDSIDDLKENYVSNNRIDEESYGGFTQSDTEWIGRSKIDTMDERLDDTKAYRFRNDKYLKCTKSRHRSCHMLRQRILRDSELETALRQREMMTSWSNQLRAMEKLLDHMKEAQRKRKRKSDFEKLMEEIEMKRTRKTTEIPVTIADPLMFDELPNALGMVDEIDVRTALKSDPLVKRILNMGRRKRDKFVTDLKKNNITLPKGTFVSTS